MTSSLLIWTLGAMASDDPGPIEQARARAARIRTSILTGDWSWLLDLSHHERFAIFEGLLQWFGPPASEFQEMGESWASEGQTWDRGAFARADEGTILRILDEVAV